MSADKDAARRLARNMELAVGEDYLRNSGCAAVKRLFSMPEYKSASSIFCYYGMGAEPDTLEIIKNALADRKNVALPVVYGDGIMKAHLIKSIQDLKTGTFGIPEPSKNNPVVEPESIDLVIVPAAAFDKAGHRLGRGGGYYDRFLKNAEHAYTVGICREKLLLEKIPYEEYDIPVMCLVSENKTARLR